MLAEPQMTACFQFDLVLGAEIAAAIGEFLARQLPYEGSDWK